MFTYLYTVLTALQPLWVLLGIVFAWGFVAMLVWSLLSAGRDAIARARQMHAIPCTNCQYFANSAVLKCTVRPQQANTEAAIHCPDYAPESRS